MQQRFTTWICTRRRRMRRIGQIAVAVRGDREGVRSGAEVVFVQIGTDYVAEGWPECKPVAESSAVHPNSIYSLTRFGGDCMTR